MTERTLVHLLRHGEVHNPEKVLYGRLPGYHLSELGRAMAVRATEALSPRDIAHIVASPLDRAQETAAPLAAATGLVVHTDPDVIEADNVFEGKPFGVGDGVLRQPRYWKHLRDPFRPSWGEPYVDLAARMRAAIDRARESARGRESVIVSHQLPIWVARLDAEKRRFAHDPRKRQCGLASLTTFHYDDELVAVTYREPCADLVRASAGAATAKGA